MARLAICGCKLYCLSLMSETGSAFPVCCSGGYPPGLRTSVCLQLMRNAGSGVPRDD